METPHIYELANLPRLLGFPFRLAAIGWMPHHLHIHRNTVIQDAFVCLSSNQQENGRSLINGRLHESPQCPAPHLGLVFPGTVIHTLHPARHDELFFQYPANCVPALKHFFGEEVVAQRGFSFAGFPEPLVMRLRQELRHPAEPGTADRLDLLAIELFTELLLRHHRERVEPETVRMKLHSIAAALCEGEALPALLKKHGFSERTFYREWGKVFRLSPARYCREQMLEQAKTWLRESDLSIAEIAARCRCVTLVRFDQIFRAHCGVSPRQYRERHRRLFPD